jgi:hypothetical protein
MELSLRWPHTGPVLDRRDKENKETLYYELYL